MSTDTAAEQATTDPAANLRAYHYPDVYRQFLGYAAKHEMTVLHEDGMYRHVRFATPGTSIGSFDLVTWPGHLTISGDLGAGWTFRREQDMFTWFADAYRHGHMVPAGHINPSYWSEKVLGWRDCRGFSEAKFAADVSEQVSAAITRHGLSDQQAVELKGDVQRDLLDDAWAYDTTSAYDAATDFRPDVLDTGGSWDQLFSDVDPEKWDDFDDHFLMACHAILWGIRTYIKETGR